MRVLHVSNHTLRFNGMSHAAVDLACAQAALGHDVGLCFGAGSFDDILSNNRVEILTVHGLDNARRLPAAAAALVRVIRQFKPDVVHAHMVAAALVAWPITRLLGIPLITCVQNSFSKHANLMRVGDLVITGCRAVADDMAGRGIPRKKLRPVLNGTIGSARQSAVVPPPAEFQHPAILTICGLHWRKGVPDLIEGFRMVRQTRPAAHLYILGEGPDEERFRAQAGPAEDSHVHFLGTGSDTRPFLKSADIFVLASIADPAPLTISEAREVGMPIVASRVDGIPELLEDGEAGILIPPKSPGAIADAIGMLLDSDEARERWRGASQIRVDRLRLSRVAAETVAVYEEAARRPAGAFLARLGRKTSAPAT
jgi:glycosyltransferase involved in cell wall biosynthesis